MGLTRIKYRYGWRWRYRGPGGKFQRLTPELRRQFFWMPRRAREAFEWLYRPEGNWVEFTYEFGYRLEGGEHREYFDYEVNLTRWVPEGDDPWMYYEGYREEARGVMYEDVAKEDIAHGWAIMPEGRKGGWRTVLVESKPWTRGPFRHRWVKK